MSFIYGGTHFFLDSGNTINIVSAINGDTTNGGDYVGPLVALAVPDDLHQSVDISTVKIEFVSRNSDGLSSQCLYEYSVSNNNPFGVSFRLDKMFDG
jgi:hypothetical protein